MRIPRLYGCFVTVLLIALLQGCGGNSGGNPGNPGNPPPGPSGPEFLYVGSSAGISIFPVNLSTGVLGSPAIKATPVNSTTVDPTSKVLYTADALTGSVHEYAIDGGTGRLAEFAGSPFPVPISNPLPALFTDTQGKFVYEGNCGFTRDSAGVLTPIISNSCFAQVGGSSNLVHPSDKFLFSACNTFDEAICVDGIGSNGVVFLLSSQGPLHFEASSLALHPSGNIVYAGGVFTLNPGVPSSSQSEQVLVMSFDGVSALSVVNQITLKTSFFGSLLPFVAVSMTPNAKFLYAAELTDIFVFAINADGSLTPVTGSPFSSGHSLMAEVQVDKSGQFLYIATDDVNGAQVVNAILAYRIDPNTGAIAPVPGSPFPFPTSPNNLLVVRTP